MLGNLYKHVRAQWAGFLALFLVITGGVAVAAFDPIGNDGDVDACFNRRSGDLDLLKGEKCGPGERRVSWSQTGPVGPQGAEGAQGPQGLEGPPGAQGSQGPQGAGAVNMILGSTGTATIDAVDDINVLAPSGLAAPTGGGASAPRDMVAPNAAGVARDLFVRVETSPGSGDSWFFQISFAAGDDLSCTISGSTDKDCNSGSQTAAVPARAQVLLVASPGQTAPASTPVDYGWRVVSP